MQYPHPSESFSMPTPTLPLTPVKEPERVTAPIHPSVLKNTQNDSLENFAPPASTGAHLDFPANSTADTLATTPVEPLAAPQPAQQAIAHAAGQLAVPAALPPEAKDTNLHSEPSPEAPKGAAIPESSDPNDKQTASEQPAPKDQPSHTETPPPPVAGGTPPSGPPPEAPPIASGQPEEPDKSSNIPEPTRKEVIAAEWGISEELVEQHARQESLLAPLGFVHWNIIDSGLETGEDALTESFAGVVPAGKTMKEDIQECAASIDQPQTIGLELGGTGSRLFGEFDEGTFDKTVSVSLTDYRRVLEDGDAVVAQDGARNHVVVEGNILHQAAHAQVDAERGEAKFAVILERMAGGLGSLPRDTVGMMQQASHWYERLAEGGVMYVEVPYALAPHIYQWKKHVSDNHPDIEVAIGRDSFHNVVRIRKGVGSPDQLPHIPLRDYVRHVRVFEEHGRGR